MKDAGLDAADRARSGDSGAPLEVLGHTSNRESLHEALDEQHVEREDAEGLF